MSEKRLRQLNMLTLIIIGVAIALIFALATYFKPDNQSKLDTGALESFNEGWVLRNYRGEDDKLIKLPTRIKAKADETLLLLHRVPDDVNSGSVLVFKTEFQNVQVYIGDLKVYENGVLNNQKLMKNAVPCINVIDLSYAEPGDIITIYISSGYKKYSGKIAEMYYGSKGDVSSWLVRQNGISFVLSVVILLVVILLGVSLIIMRNMNVDKRKSGYAFGFIFAAALWSLVNNPLMQLITENVFGIYMASMILLLILPILYMMYQRCMATKKRYAQIFEIALYAFAINFLTGTVFQLVEVCDFATYMIFTKVLIVLGLILLSGMMYLSNETFRDRTVHNNFIANIVLSAGAILETIFSLFRFYKPLDGVIFQVGLFIFLIIMVVTVEKGIINEMNQTTKKAIDEIELEKDMAIKNVNTGLVYKALAQAAGNLKQTNLSDGKLIYDTSVYMRCNLKAATEKGLVPFAKELEYIRAYLGIQGKRFPELDIAIEDKVVNFKVPFNSVEPIVENAIENGALRSEAAGRFVIRSYERLDCFAIQIVDNGPGISPEREFKGNIGYFDAKKRLKSMCKAGIEIKCKPDKGSIVTVKIPKDGYIIKED